MGLTIKTLSGSDVLIFLEKDIHLKGIEMNELERTALNEILRTVTYIAEKLDELEFKLTNEDLQDSEHPE